MRLLHRGGAEGWKTGCMDGDTGSWSCTAGPGPSPCPAGEGRWRKDYKLLLNKVHNWLNPYSEGQS